MTPAERKQEQRRGEAIAEVLAIPDTRGRLHNERSGEADRDYGMSEMERIVAAQERDENGRHVTPTGAAPTQMEEDSTTDTESTTADLRMPYMDEMKFRNWEENISAIGEWLAGTRLDGSRYCWVRDCGVPLNSAEARERHVWEAYERGHRQHEHIQLLKEANAPQALIDEANAKLQTDWHFRVVMDRLGGRIS